MSSPLGIKSFLLPKLKTDTDLKLETVGQWNDLSAETFEKVANSLDVKPVSQAMKHVGSIPDMWARPLAIEMALYIDDYPIRSQIIDQWRGMLAAIAFAELKKFDLKVRRIDLEQEQSDPFASSLIALPPSLSNTLYTLSDKNPWFDLYLFLWKGQPVGMTSPSTLVCPSEDGNWNGLPWWKNGQLQSPIKFLKDAERKELQFWLEHLSREIADTGRSYQGKKDAKNTLLRHLQDFQEDLASEHNANQEWKTISKERLKARLSHSTQYFEETLELGVLTALSQPIRGTSLDWLSPDSSALMSLDIFLPNLSFVDYGGSVPPGCFLLPGSENLTFNGRKIFPLVPLSPGVLDTLQANKLSYEDAIQFRQIKTSENSIIRVTVKLPTTEGGHETHFQDYTLQPENCISELPVLEIWPYFQAESWQEYYTFYYDGTHGNDTFRVDFPNFRTNKAENSKAENSHRFEDQGGFYQISQLTAFPSFATCDRNDRLIGLILFKAPPKIPQAGIEWKVGVDFGTSFTNVYVNNGQITPLKTRSSLHLSVIGNPEIRRSVFEYFIPESFISKAKPLPFASILTHRQHQNSLNMEARPIFDGRIYIPQDSASFEPAKQWIRTNLKWSGELEFSSLLLKQLALHITALAKQEGVSKIQWCVSFPLAFSRNDKTRYLEAWIKISEELGKKTGIEFSDPDVKDSQTFCSESLAIARYFAFEQKVGSVSTTYIDVGGGTSDISIRDNNRPVHQCSVRLAGKHLFTQFIELNSGF